MLAKGSRILSAPILPEKKNICYEIEAQPIPWKFTVLFLGMDPAGPEFIGKPEENRLDPSDADMVIAIHTNGGNLITGEVGYFDECGHVDFYPHGGHHQPGCTDLGPLWDLLTGK